MTNFSFIIVDQDTVCPHVIDVVPCELSDIARVIHADICSEIINMAQLYTMSHVCFGPAAIEIEDFLHDDANSIAAFLDEEFTGGSFSFIICFSDDGDLVEDLEYRYTIQDCPNGLFHK